MAFRRGQKVKLHNKTTCTVVGRFKHTNPAAEHMIPEAYWVRMGDSAVVRLADAEDMVPIAVAKKAARKG